MLQLLLPIVFLLIHIEVFNTSLMAIMASLTDIFSGKYMYNISNNIS